MKVSILCASLISPYIAQNKSPDSGISSSMRSSLPLVLKRISWIIVYDGDLEEEVYMKQPEGFSSSESEHFVCKLDKSICSSKQASQ